MQQESKAREKKEFPKITRAKIIKPDERYDCESPEQRKTIRFGETTHDTFASTHEPQKETTSVQSKAKTK